MKKFWGSAAMIAATIIWGLAFSAQSSGMKFIDPIARAGFDISTNAGKELRRLFILELAGDLVFAFDKTQ